MSTQAELSVLVKEAREFAANIRNQVAHEFGPHVALYFSSSRIANLQKIIDQLATNVEENSGWQPVFDIELDVSKQSIIFTMVQDGKIARVFTTFQAVADMTSDELVDALVQEFYQSMIKDKLKALLYAPAEKAKKNAETFGRSSL